MPRPAFLLTLLLLPSAIAFGSGEETRGNAPLPNNRDWAKGVVDVVNLKSRVFSQWINGNETFYYKGDAGALNEALAKFAAIEGEVREVLLWPGPGEARTLVEQEKIPCDWSLNVPSGIYLHLLRREKGPGAAPPRSRFTIFHAEALDPKTIRFPAGLTVLEPADIIARHLDGLTNPDLTLRGQSAYRLGEFVPLAGRAVEPLRKLLDDRESYVRQSAEGALGRLGAAAAPALPDLKRKLSSKDEAEREAVRRAIDAIEAARKSNATNWSNALDAIRKFRVTVSPRAGR